jgi:methylated-DNA-[protein]-cysteine S-methyltransferase
MLGGFVYAFDIGPLYIQDDGAAITAVRLLRGEGADPIKAATASDTTGADVAQRESALTQEAARQLTEYFQGKRMSFNLPLAPRGTDFQQRVWQALRDIPYGQTASYGEIAKRMGNPRACRAVGLANNRNPIIIIIPCHRVIGADGSLVGYGAGLGLKKRLLALEAANAPLLLA